jgi:hypothetical protein
MDIIFMVLDYYVSCGLLSAKPFTPMLHFYSVYILARDEDSKRVSGTYVGSLGHLSKIDYE